MLQGAPIVWYSKKQQAVEASTLGAEFVALQVACKMNDALRYKLRMMGFPLNSKTSTYCDNQLVVNNTSKVEFTLKKKHLSVCYHYVCESCAKGTIRISCESTATSLADACTQIMSWFQKKINYDVFCIYNCNISVGFCNIFVMFATKLIVEINVILI